MSYFKAKMHQIRFLLGLRPIDPAGPGAHSACPDPLTGFEGVLLLREGGGGGNARKGMEGKGKKRKKVGNGGGAGREGKGCVVALGDGLDAPGCKNLGDVLRVIKATL